MLYKEPVFIEAGDSALILRAGEGISIEVHQRVRELLMLADEAGLEGVTDLIPSYNELMICIDPLLPGAREVERSFQDFWKQAGSSPVPPPMLVKIPVLYGGEWGPDLEELSKMKGLSPEEVIRMHSSVDYLVYMLGFNPGFCYLGGLEKRLVTPRKTTPRLKIPAGSVGIAGSQTGIYPQESPGGWQLIGRTPLAMFDPAREPVFLAAMGDYIRFVPVSQDHYKELEEACRKGGCLPEITEMK